jgi:serine kinase of HPr protein (carbohydrate metabolism regulator)
VQDEWQLLHATAVAIDGLGVLIEGPSGSGKSDLALRLLDRGAALVADDQVHVARDGGAVRLACPERIAGLIEVRGLGILRVKPAAEAPLALCVTLGEEARLPEPATRDVLGTDVRAVTLDPRAPSAPIKVELALRRPEAMMA